MSSRDHENPLPAGRSCPNGEACDGDECPVCDHVQVAFLAGAGPASFVLYGIDHLARADGTDGTQGTEGTEGTDGNQAAVLHRFLDDVLEQTSQLPVDDHEYVIRGLVFALRRHIPEPRNDGLTGDSAPDEGEAPLVSGNLDSCQSVEPSSLEALVASLGVKDHVSDQVDEVVSSGVTGEIVQRPAFVCGHPLHGDTHHHYDQGRVYASHILTALDAAQANELASAEINAHAADRVLWQHAETCDDDLRDFIAGIANLNEKHLESLGTRIYY